MHARLSVSSARTLIAAGVVLVVLLAGRGRGASAVDIHVVARSVRPGELVVLTITPAAGAAGVAVRAFEQQVPTYMLRAGVWQALVGIDLDQKPGNYTVTVEAHAGADTLRGEETLVVRPRTFATRTLRVDPEFVNPGEALLARIESDAVFLRDVMERSAPERLWRAPFVRPVPDPANSRFGTRSVFNGEVRRPHGGADFLSAAGTPVRAPNAGRVAAARDLFFTGNTVVVDHGLGVVSLLAHLSAMDVQEGQTVAAGQIVGRVGATGRVTGPHLHWGVTVAGARVDPLSVLAVVGESSTK
jgi:murein DD-endopeptidase MepM/ murein hydrolase activator NlpD